MMRKYELICSLEMDYEKLFYVLLHKGSIILGIVSLLAVYPLLNKPRALISLGFTTVCLSGLSLYFKYNN